MFGKIMYLYCLCCVKDISKDISEDQVEKDRDMDLNGEEDIILNTVREENCRDVAEEGDYNNNIHALRWEFYIKYKE